MTQNINSSDDKNLNVQYRITSKFRLEGNPPLLNPQLTAKHLLSGNRAAAGNGGLVIFAGKSKRYPLHLKAEGSFRYKYTLTPLGQCECPSSNFPESREDWGYQKPCMCVPSSETGNPAHFECQSEPRSVAVGYERSAFGFAGITTEWGADLQGNTWAGMGRIGADFALESFLFASLSLEASTIGHFFTSLELTAATPYVIFFFIPSVGISVGVVEELSPNITTFIRTRALIQYPVAGLSLGYDWALSSEETNRFHITLSLSF